MITNMFRQLIISNYKSQYKDKISLIKIIIISRFVIVLISGTSNYFIPHYANDSFKSPNINLTSSGECFLDKAAYILYGGLTNWDSQHFLHIGKNGYTYENNLAFFPGYPLIIRFLTSLLHSVTYSIISYDYLLLTIAVNLNIFLSILNCLLVYDLTLSVFKCNDYFAYLSSLLYCISPSSIFFTAPYTETLFTYFVFTGFYYYSTNCLIKSILSFTLSCTVRSNGLLNIYFIGIFIFHNLIKKLSFFYLIAKLILLILSFLSLLFPFGLYQLYCYGLFCSHNKSIRYSSSLVNYANANQLIMPHNDTEWCTEKLKISYFYIQNKYWNVGFLKYYQWKQIPNFILAFPITYIITFHSYRFLKYYITIKLKALKGVIDFYKKKKYRFTTLYESFLLFEPNDLVYEKSPYILPFNAYHYVFHVTFLLIYSLLFANVQIITRMLTSSSPVFYWITALHLIKSDKRINLLKLFISTYFFLGAIFFSVGLPWT